MESRYGPGVAFYEISDWRNFSPKSKNKDIIITKSTPFESITQKLMSDNSDVLEMYWEFNRKNDSVTTISLSVGTSINELANRWAIVNPFRTSVYIDSLKQRVLEFKKRLNDVQQTYKVSLDSKITSSPEMNCICHSSSNIPIDSKASEMLGTIGYLENYVLERDLELTGPPFIKITSWNKVENVIAFDFCFPVNLAQDIKPTLEVSFREFKSSSALKAIFNGNYRLSHLAWYDLLDKATESGLNTNSLPLEIFYNNPKVEANSESWKAEIYLPVME
ncbi:hypothetical protein GCM10011532_26840 [Christiangramia forsetii]|nr:hypothetical protein GCM10011532_26840 [Christiangramia forsetii]